MTRFAALMVDALRDDDPFHTDDEIAMLDAATLARDAFLPNGGDEIETLLAGAALAMDTTRADAFHDAATEFAHRGQANDARAAMARVVRMIGEEQARSFAAVAQAARTATRPRAPANETTPPRPRRRAA